MDIPPCRGQNHQGVPLHWSVVRTLYSPSATTQSTASVPPVMSLPGQSPHRGFNLRMLQVYLSRASDEATYSTFPGIPGCYCPEAGNTFAEDVLSDSRSPSRTHVSSPCHVARNKPLTVRLAGLQSAPPAEPLFTLTPPWLTVSNPCPSLSLFSE